MSDRNKLNVPFHFNCGWAPKIRVQPQLLVATIVSEEKNRFANWGNCLETNEAHFLWRKSRSVYGPNVNFEMRSFVTPACAVCHVKISQGQIAMTRKRWNQQTRIILMSKSKGHRPLPPDSSGDWNKGKVTWFQAPKINGKSWLAETREFIYKEDVRSV